MSNWKCPPRKRQAISYQEELHGSLHTVIIEGVYFDGRGHYHGNHETFEWLHHNVENSWHCLEGKPFDFTVKTENRWRHETFQFEREEDAVLFQLKFNGKLLGADFEARRNAENEVRRILNVVERLPREDRLREFPGLDELLVGRTTADC